MWNYTKCTSADREEKLNKLADIFSQEKNCIKYLSEVQKYIHSTQTTIVLLQDVEANVLIEMDYVPVNDYIFHVVAIEETASKIRAWTATLSIRPSASLKCGQNQYNRQQEAAHEHTDIWKNKMF